MRLGRDEICKYDIGAKKEWILANGIGGFASQTCAGGNTRRYHGLLTAALCPPARRQLLVSAIHEGICFEGSRTEHAIAAFRTADYTEEGCRYLTSFSADPLPCYEYTVEDASLKKEITMIYGKNATVVRYTVTTGGRAVTCRFTPLVNFRDFHGDIKAYRLPFATYDDGCGHFRAMYKGKTRDDATIRFRYTKGVFKPCEYEFFFGMKYDQEEARGLQAYEDHYIPGTIELEVRAHREETLEILMYTEQGSLPGQEIDWNTDAFEDERRRLDSVREACTLKDERARDMAMYSDIYFAYRESTGRHTIIAGYPWFSDWGRDAMIAVTGLCTATGRYSSAKEIIETFAQYERGGMLPNTFPDRGSTPWYNTADAPLWLFEAVYRLYRADGDYEFARKMLPTMKNIIEAYLNGTGTEPGERISVNACGLVECGSIGSQMTWMDAKVGNIAFTPRYGCAVEINALWYNALAIAAFFSEKEAAEAAGAHSSENAEAAEAYRAEAERVKQSFRKYFIDSESGRIYDNIRFADGGTGLRENIVVSEADDSVRPNQIIACGLSHVILENGEIKAVLDTVSEKLYTPVGLRTLSRDDKMYRGEYAGDMYARDSAYHQGTVWMWPLGFYFSAGLDSGYFTKDRVRQLLEPVFDHLRDACVNHCSEIFDGDEPNLPKGAVAQAWSEGEILRVMRLLEE